MSNVQAYIDAATTRVAGFVTPANAAMTAASNSVTNLGYIAPGDMTLTFTAAPPSSIDC